ncbi:T9SS type A sorting domain-containing protein [Hanstruepera ponticola]|uniref:T9SS type A sorting domain-containing protein n=1 Tax=Hanstruepera ponticola TaxID=2042995 RepID=UPI00177DFD36|nr:T9SS type A sorting domain-containing protein [Hanstruepera ponticola]
MKKITFLFILVFTVTLHAQTPGGESAITTIDATIPYQGFGESLALLGSGEYKIYYDNVDGVLDKPIFFVDGFDPNDTRDIDAMYSLLNYGNSGENLGDTVRDEGYDLVVLNFPEEYLSPTDGTTMIKGGADFIQRNAFILVELINTINQSKVMGAEENVVIGPSMGGLISRYALAYMESQSIDHDTRLYISFDSPHLGANVPIGIQYLFNYMVNGEPGISEAEPLVSGLLNSAAAKQMLIDHYLGHVDSGGINQDGTSPTPKGAPNFRDSFQSELDGLGFPQNVRNVSITNGSGTGQLTGTPGMELINHTFNTGMTSGFNTRAIIRVNFTPDANQNIEVTDFVGQAFIFIGWVTGFEYSASAESTSTSDGLDSAPGGQFDLYAFDDGTNPLITEFVDNLNSQYFNFIPTLSGLAISSETDWYTIPDANDAPFANTYIPTNNEPHVTLTDGNVAFALEEIRSETLNVSQSLIAINDMMLQQNPVHNQITLLSERNHYNSSVSIIDMTGQVVFNEKIDIANKTDISINLPSGMYAMQINTTDNSLKTMKLIVN